MDMAAKAPNPTMHNTDKLKSSRPKIADDERTEFSLGD